MQAFHILFLVDIINNAVPLWTNFTMFLVSSELVSH